MKISIKKINTKHILIALFILVAFATGFGLKCALTDSNIAVVNLKQVVGHSQKLMIVRKENDAKLKELSQWLDGIEKEISSEKDKKKRQNLAKQYKELAKEKENLIKQEYNKKLKEIDAEITALVEEVADKAGCKVILDQNVVVKGGQNITSDVIKKLNPETPKEK